MTIQEGFTMDVYGKLKELGLTLPEELAGRAIDANA